MATVVPVTIATTTNPITSDLSKIETDAVNWFKQYEKVVIVLILVVGLAWGYNKYLSNDVAKAQIAQTQAAQTLAAQQSKDEAYTATIKADMDKYTAMVTQVNQQNAQLATQISQSNATLAAKIDSNNSMSTSQLASAMQQAVQSTAGAQVTLGPAASTVILNQKAAVTAVDDEDQVASLKVDLTNQTAISTDLKGELDSANVLIGTQIKDIADLNLAVTDEKNACTSEVNLVKAQARKSKLHYFEGGVIVGFASGIALHLW